MLFFFSIGGLLGVCLKPIMNAFVVTLSGFGVVIIIRVAVAARLDILENVVHGFEIRSEVLDLCRRFFRRRIGWSQAAEL